MALAALALGVATGAAEAGQITVTGGVWSSEVPLSPLDPRWMSCILYAHPEPAGPVTAVSVCAGSPDGRYHFTNLDDGRTYTVYGMITVNHWPASWCTGVRTGQELGLRSYTNNHYFLLCPGER